jgi:hypothetical protein
MPHSFSSFLEGNLPWFKITAAPFAKKRFASVARKIYKPRERKRWSLRGLSNIHPQKCDFFTVFVDPLECTGLCSIE